MAKKTKKKKKRAGVGVTNAYKNGTKASGFIPFSGYSRMKRKKARKK